MLTRNVQNLSHGTQSIMICLTEPNVRLLLSYEHLMLNIHKHLAAGLHRRRLAS